MAQTLLEKLQAYSDKVDSPERLALFAGIGAEHYADAEYLNLLREGVIQALSVGVGIQDNIDIEKPFSFYKGDNYDAILARLNAIGTFEVVGNKSVWFTGNEVFNGTGLPRLMYFKLINNGEGIYGVGGKKLGYNDLLLVRSEEANELNVGGSSLTQKISFGALVGKSISQWLNTQNPAIILQDQEQGYVLFKGTIDGVDKSYLFIGTAGSYGVGQLQCTDASFQALTNEVAVASIHRPVKNITTSTAGFVAGVYTLQDGDRDYWLSFSVPVAFQIKVPVMLQNTLIEGDTVGDGQATFIAGTGVTLRYALSELPKTAEKYSVFGLKYRSPLNVSLYGRLQLL